MQAIRRVALALALFAPLALSPAAHADTLFPGVGTVHLDEATNVLTLTVPYRGRNPFHVLWLSNPSRLVVDVDGMRLEGGRRAMYIGGGVVSQIRAGLWQGRSTRVVFDLAQAADLRATTDASAGVIELLILPRGAAPATGAAPEEQMGMASPVRRPPARPVPRGTPRLNPIFTEATPTPEPTPMPTMMPVPSFEPTPFPTPNYSPFPEPVESPSPSPEPEASTEPAVEERPFSIFGSKAYLGLDMPLSLTETYPAGNSDTSVSLIPAGVFGIDQMFGANFGIHLGGHAISYTIDDQAARDEGFQLQHKRSIYEGNLGVRGRFDFGGGLEVYAQPGAIVRYTGVSNTLNTIDADGNLIEPVDPAVDDYLSSGSLGYGPQLQAGIGYHVGGPFSLAALGEYNFLLGSMNSTTVTGVFPMSGYRVGLESRLDFGLLGVTLGYNLTSFGGASGELSQFSHGPLLQLNLVY